MPTSVFLCQYQKCLCNEKSHGSKVILELENIVTFSLSVCSNCFLTYFIFLKRIDCQGKSTVFVYDVVLDSILNTFKGN